jgi:hypothetical protein
MLIFVEGFTVCIGKLIYGPSSGAILLEIGIAWYILKKVFLIGDPLCGLIVRVPGYRFRGPGSIPGTVRFSEK